MKKILSFLGLIACFFVLTSESCKHDDNSNITPSTSSSISTTTPGAGWKLTLLSEGSDNKTSHFSGYTFDFAANGTMTASGSQSATGTWRQYQDDGVTKFEITLVTTDKNMAELNDDWVLVSKSETFISLKDDNAAKNELLQFSK